MAARVAAFAVIAIGLMAPGAVVAQDSGSFVRVVHAASDVGPVDLYIDGRLSVVGAAFPSATDPLSLAGGDHRITVVPSGAALDAAVLDTTITIGPRATEEVAIVGDATGIRAVVFPVDDAPIDGDRARFRVVHAIPDAGPIDAAFAGGEAIFPTVEYLAATEYAEVPPESIAIDFIVTDIAAVAASLAELALAPGEVVDVYLVGRVADGAVQPLVVRTRLEVAAVVGRPFSLRTGGCDEPDAVVADLGVAGPPRGAELGTGDGAVVETGLASAPVSFDSVIGAPHVVVVAGSQADDASVEACGAVGGALTDDGSLAFPLVGPGGDSRGVAVVATGVLDPTTIDVSVFLLPSANASELADAAAAATATPAAASDADEEARGQAVESTPSPSE